MNFLLTGKNEKEKKFAEKEVRKMKKITILLALILAVLAGANSAFATIGNNDIDGTLGSNPIQAAADDFTQIQFTNVTTTYNKYGIATGSISVTITRTTGDSYSSVTQSIVTSKWVGGTLKTESVAVNSTTTQGNDVTVSNYTDTYTYNANGDLIGCTGGGTYNSKTYDETGGVVSLSEERNGAITRTFTLQDGQALLTESSTAGTIYDEGGLAGDNTIGSFNNTTTIALSDYQYHSGTWMQTKETSASSSSKTDGSSENMTRVLNYTRSANGVITGISQDATGSRTNITGIDEGTPATVSSALRTETVYWDDDENPATPEVPVMCDVDLDGNPNTTDDIQHVTDEYHAFFTFDAQDGWILTSEYTPWMIVAANP